METHGQRGKSEFGAQELVTQFKPDGDEHD